MTSNTSVNSSSTYTTCTIPNWPVFPLSSAQLLGDCWEINPAVKIYAVCYSVYVGGTWKKPNYSFSFEDLESQLSSDAFLKPKSSFDFYFLHVCSTCTLAAEHACWKALICTDVRMTHLSGKACSAYMGQWLAYLEAGQPTGRFEYKEEGGCVQLGMRRSGRALLFAAPSLLFLSLSLLGQGWKRLTEAGEETCHERWWHSHEDTLTSSLFPKLAFAAQAAAASDKVQKSLNLSLFSPPVFFFKFSFTF